MKRETKIIKVIGVRGEVSVSENGEVRYNQELKHQSLIKDKSHRYGYMQVSIEGQRLYVHRLVAQAFVRNPKPVSNKMVFHIDHNTLNNHYSNLKWGNRQDAIERMRATRKEELKNPNYRGTSKLSGDDAVKIAARLDGGETAKVLSAEYGVSEMSIARIRKRYCKQKSASPRYSQEHKEMVRKLLMKFRPVEVAKSTGIRYETILKWKKQFAASE
ncbi:HNH endonuclease [Carboxylicivirga sp. M1479]|uniref:HNH endonuclease n=1 Tax=Carboxylicivirga sp. M1479 TaxID=2594476 RepID=UPI0011777B39|nr:HNH endonuclease [Carboxylicivirga sp. M1479]TRX72232.1 hypothetical protein FNN09_02345 [Carboxylicivirga sp. M1479]